MMTDEVYGKLGGVLEEHGCPWGWTRFIDMNDPTAPKIEAEYRLPSNNPDICDTVGEDRNNFSSFASHNPTMTRNLALLTWHSAGMQAIDTSNPANPQNAGQFLPEPLDRVQTEDPALSSGRDKVVMWSFPIVKDGLIYVVDIRNGLYILKYRGVHEQEVENAKFLDGNSNSGDVQQLEPVAGAPTAKSPDTPASQPNPATTAPTGGSSGGSGGGSAPSTPAAPAKDAVGDGRSCLAFARLRGRSLGPFSLGSTAAAVALRAGPAQRTTSGRRRYCVSGGSGLEVLLRRGRVAMLLRAVSRPPRRKGSDRIRVRRGSRGANRVVVFRGGRLVATGIASKGLSKRTLRALAKRTLR